MNRSLRYAANYFTIGVFAISLALGAPHAVALHSLAKYVNATSLANPGLLIVNPADGKVLTENRPDSLRVPASVLKLVSTTTALHYLGPDKTFTTSIWSTSSSDTFVIRGSLDPWLTSNLSLSKKNNQRYLPYLTGKANTKNKKSLKIYYEGMYEQDFKELSTALRSKGIRITTTKVTSAVAEEKAKEEIASMTSAPVAEMVSFAIMWSVNTLADRLGKAAARKVGNSTDPEGLTKTFVAALTELGIETKGLKVEDGSGLSKANRLSARTLVSLLAKIRNDSTFESIYEGMPVSGISGTLKKRFQETAPNAIGHVHAKTGWVNHSVTMAGYVDDGETEYVFAILADGITPTFKARNAARAAMDKLLGVIVTGNH